jgi:two-component system, OmpR family, sensor histidine kinase KdpD
MKAFGRILFIGNVEGRLWQRYAIDTLLAVFASAIVTLFIYGEKLYPAIPNISFLYLLVVLALASRRGLYAAIIASIAAFLSFDFFLVDPLFTFTINKFEEWLALFIFLVTAIITGQLASALKQRAEEAVQREKETRALYELVNATTNVESLERQLAIVARAILTNFASVGVSDCAILLPDAHGTLQLQADACNAPEQMLLSSDEMKTAATVLHEGKIIDLYGNVSPSFPPSPLEKVDFNRYTRVVNASSTNTRLHYVRLIPLQMGQNVVGVVRLLMETNTHHVPTERAKIGGEQYQQAAFFWTFFDQATSMIERARLHRETMEIELLRRTDALRSSLLSSVSHDLRTPLSSIKASASSLLQEDVQWDEEARRSFATTIEHEADRLNRLVGNLLDMSRIEGGALKPEKEWYPIGELIQDVLNHMQSVLQGRDVQLSLPGNLPPVELDYLQIDQVVTNLLENVVRYTPANSPIEITACVVDGQIEISIADHGPGIPSYELERIFDKFYRISGTARKNTSIMGTGLGLAVCRGLIEAHGGRIWAENRPEGGAIFRFTLPIGNGEGITTDE